MSKRSERIAKAKARSAEETAALRATERAKPPVSSVAKFIAGSAKGRTLSDVVAEQELLKQQQKERDAALRRKQI